MPLLSAATGRNEEHNPRTNKLTNGRMNERSRLDDVIWFLLSSSPPTPPGERESLEAPRSKSRCEVYDRLSADRHWNGGVVPASTLVVARDRSGFAAIQVAGGHWWSRADQSCCNNFRSLNRMHDSERSQHVHVYVWMAHKDYPPFCRVHNRATLVVSGGDSSSSVSQKD